MSARDASKSDDKKNAQSKQMIDKKKKHKELNTEDSNTVSTNAAVKKDKLSVPRLKDLYMKKIMPELAKKFGYKSIMAVPRIEKIVLNIGIGEAVNDKKLLDHASNDLIKISGQKPVITCAKKSIAGFKIRDGYPIGCKVTLRSNRMYEFFDRLISIAIPRIRDFRGLSDKSFDQNGNYNFGILEQIIFPEIDYDKVDKIRGMNITITIKSKGKAESKELLTAFGFPFMRTKNNG